ncbi:acyl-CoA reductase [Luteolibacter sp. AS25]|uniref:acyl-CoA reductase n=1 Tax=Luteolibacter sp. AS25 TaxID=3135776 RepID=UPI00398A98A7
MNLRERINLLLSHLPTLERWVGPYDEASLLKWLDSELGNSRRLEHWVDGSRATPRGPVLHVVSGNTPHAAFQTTFRAFLIGCQSWVKIPSAGLPEFERWATHIPLIELRRELPEAWKSPEIAIVYGAADTIDFFRNWLSTGTRLIEHGPKLSAAFIFQPTEDTYQNLAQDIMRYGQRGCLSIQMIYAAGDLTDFCEKLSVGLNSFPEKNHPTLSEAGAVRNERELIRFRAANGANLQLFESKNSVDWTIVLDQENTLLRPGPLSGFVHVAPIPEVISHDTLGPEVEYLSTAVLEPISMAGELEKIAPPRICQPGHAQEPGIFWHPDGEMPLAGLVRWRDLG